MSEYTLAYMSSRRTYKQAFIILQCRKWTAMLSLTMLSPVLWFGRTIHLIPALARVSMPSIITAPRIQHTTWQAVTLAQRHHRPMPLTSSKNHLLASRVRQSQTPQQVIVCFTWFCSILKLNCIFLRSLTQAVGCTLSVNFHNYLTTLDCTIVAPLLLLFICLKILI